MKTIANILDALAILSAIIGLVLFAYGFIGSAGGQAQIGTVIFAIGFAVIPYCISNIFRRAISE
jgi:hypothetical protein